MRQELDQLLCERYPKIFANRHADMKTTAMCWGFEHDDGWFNIIDRLCSNIQHHVDWSHKDHAWDIKWNQEHPEEPRPVRGIISQVVADQVKEKFGALRFYYHGGDDIVDGMARMAESMSAVTCEQCGAPGRQRGRGWIMTRCDEHAKEDDHG
jgi:hypothetical protein